MKKKTILDFIFQFKTYKLSFNYLEIYKHLIMQIMLKKDTFSVNFFKILNIFNLLKSVHFAFLAYYPLSDYQKLINFDAAYYIVLKSKFNLMFSVCQIIIIIYGNKALFTDANIRLIQLLENIIVKNDSSCFSIPTHKRKNLCKVIQRNFMAYLNLFQSVITITSKMKFFV